MATVAWTGRPSSSAGYWRGGGGDGPFWMNQGSGYGPDTQGVGILPPGTAAQTGKSWSPTVIYLLVFVVVEMVAVKLLERVLS